MSISISHHQGIRDYKRERMESVCKSLIDEADLNVLIKKVQAERGFNEAERLWIVWKTSQIQAARNIVHIAIDGLNIIGVGMDE